MYLWFVAKCEKMRIFTSEHVTRVMDMDLNQFRRHLRTNPHYAYKLGVELETTADLRRTQLHAKVIDSIASFEERIIPSDTMRENVMAIAGLTNILRSTQKARSEKEGKNGTKQSHNLSISYTR